MTKLQLSFVIFIFALTLHLNAKVQSGFKADSLPLLKVPLTEQSLGSGAEALDFSSALKLEFTQGTLYLLCNESQLFIKAKLDSEVAPVVLTQAPGQKFGKEDAMFFRFDPNLRGRNTKFIGLNFSSSAGISGESYSLLRPIKFHHQVKLGASAWELYLTLSLAELGISKDSSNLLGFHAERLFPNKKTEFLPKQHLVLGRESVKLRFSSKAESLEIHAQQLESGTLTFERDGVLQKQALNFRNGLAVAKLPLDSVGDLPFALTVTDYEGVKYSNYCRAEFYLNLYEAEKYRKKVIEDKNLIFWTTSSMDKVLPDSELPTQGGALLRAELARHEYEGIPLHIYAAEDTEFMVEISDLSSSQGQVIKASNVTLFHLDTVPCRKPSDGASYRGDWPDPLVPLEGSLFCPKEQNTSLYLRFYVPKNTPAGKYSASLSLNSDKTSRRIPVQLEVFDFTLPDDNAMKSVCLIWGMEKYLNIKSKEDRDRYRRGFYKLFKQYRLAPGDLFMGVKIKFEDGKCDFSEFDERAKEVFDEFKFTDTNISRWTIDPTYRFDIPRPSDEVMAQVEVAYRQVYEHLKQKKYLDKIYWYDADEQPKPVYPALKTHFEFIGKLFPGMRRFLTVTQLSSEELDGVVESWCPIIDIAEKDLEFYQAQQKKGREFWWYTCDFPVAPYPTEFIDAPGIMQRVYYWLAEKYGVDGVLYWGADYGPNVGRNSFENPLYGSPETVSSRNGTGFMVYPPCRQAPQDTVAEAPWPSIRMEYMRDGMEDREYFRLAKNQVQRLRALPVEQRPLDLIAKLEHALQEFPSLIGSSLTRYETDPGKLLELRRRLAYLIVAAKQIAKP